VNALTARTFAILGCLIVASVVYNHARWNFTIQGLPSHSVNGLIFAVYPNLSVAIRPSGLFPNHAIIHQASIP
jgi:hypothetical protein